MTFISPLPLLRAPMCQSVTHVRRSRKPQTAYPRRRLRVRAMAQPPEDRPEGSVITRALELSFRAVWIQLVTRGVGQEYEAAIQEFVVTCLAAYKAGYSITALKLELSANEITAKYMGRDTALNEQEKETRLTWIALVYLTLARYGFSSENKPPAVKDDVKGGSLEKLVPGLQALVGSVCDAADRGYNLQTFKMEESLKRDVGGDPLSSAQASIKSQWSRIVFTTVRILPDSLKKK